MDGEEQVPDHESVAFSGTQVVLTVEKVGLKDAKEGYVNPFCTITVASGGTGAVVEGEPPQDTAFAVLREPQHVVFDHKVTLRNSLERLQQLPGVGIFIEMKHYKPKTEKVSCKCYGFMELDELKDGPVVLEVLKSEKPTDFARKGKPKRLSVKDLYMHLTVELTQK